VPALFFVKASLNTKSCCAPAVQELGSFGLPVTAFYSNAG